MKTIAIVLIVLGGLALAYGGFDYTRNRTVLQVGDMHVEASENRSVAIPAAAGAIAVVGGFVLLVAGNRRSGRSSG